MCYFNPSASPVDNGNITKDELHIGKTQLEKTIQRHLFHGSALVILCAGDKAGKIDFSNNGAVLLQSLICNRLNPRYEM